MNRVEAGPRPSGILLLNKPAGRTSFQALFPLKRKLGSGKVGHAGTLDKFASGLLVVLVGPYSRLNEFVSAGEKLYRGVVRFGAETATLDPEGEVVAEAPAPDRLAIEAALPGFRGPIMQRPPAYSALHIDGKRAYERVLAGEELEMEPRPVTIHEFSIESYDGRDAVVLVRCSPGTYIRSLARDLALACGSRASLVALERLAIGPFRLADAVSPEDFEPQRDLRLLGPAEASSLGLGLLELASAEAPRFVNGAQLADLHFKPQAAEGEGGPFAVFDPSGKLLGIVERAGKRMKYRLVLGAAS